MFSEGGIENEIKAKKKLDWKQNSESYHSLKMFVPTQKCKCFY